MKIRKVAGAAVTSVGLVIGMSAFAGATTGTLDVSGNHSGANLNSTSNHQTWLSNNNNAGVANLNGQGAHSGAAKVTGNKSQGSASTGSAMNAASSSTSLTVSNSGSTAAALMATPAAAESHSANIDVSGNNSGANVNYSTNNQTWVTNNNNVGVVNGSVQTATSGNASVKGNKSLGSASTGAVSNTNNTSTTVSISN